MNWEAFNLLQTEQNRVHLILPAEAMSAKCWQYSLSGPNTLEKCESLQLQALSAALFHQMDGERVSMKREGLEGRETNRVERKWGVREHRAGEKDNERGVKGERKEPKEVKSEKKGWGLSSFSFNPEHVPFPSLLLPFFVLWICSPPSSCEVFHEASGARVKKKKRSSLLILKLDQRRGSPAILTAHAQSTTKRTHK